MALVTIDNSVFSSIASAIRAKLGVSTTYKPGAMADAIASISGGGISGVDLLYSNDAESITYTSTSAGTAKTISGLSNLAKYPFVVVVIENTNTASGSLKFIRSTTVIGNINFASNTVSATRYGTQHYYNSSSALVNASSTTYGLWGYTLTAAGALTIRGRTNTAYYTSLTGTYKVRVLGVKF